MPDRTCILFNRFLIRKSLNLYPCFVQVCSGDVVHFKWSGEQMGLYGFYNENAYRKCAKGNLNYMKNTRPKGSFKTKPNRSGWRYYAHIGGAGDGACKYGCGNPKNKTNRITGTCEQRIAILWQRC